MKVEIDIPDNVIEFLRAFPIGDIQTHLRHRILNDIGADLDNLYEIDGLFFHEGLS